MFFWTTYTYVSKYLPQNTNFKGKKVTEESPDKHHLYQVIKININHNGTNGNCVHLIGCGEMNKAPCLIFLPKLHKLNLAMT